MSAAAATLGDLAATAPFPIRRQTNGRSPLFQRIVGASEAMLDMYERIEKIAPH